MSYINRNNDKYQNILYWYIHTHTYTDLRDKYKILCTELLLLPVFGFGSENGNLVLFQSFTVLLFVPTVTPTSTTWWRNTSGCPLRCAKKSPAQSLPLLSGDGSLPDISLPVASPCTLHKCSSRVMVRRNVFPLSCKKYKTALEDLYKASNAGSDESSQAARCVCFFNIMYVWIYFCMWRIKFLNVEYHLERQLTPENGYERCCCVCNCSSWIVHLYCSNY